MSSVSERSEEAAALWRDITDLATNEALGGFVVFTSTVGIYDSNRLGDLEPWPIGNYIIPDPHTTYIRSP